MNYCLLFSHANLYWPLKWKLLQIAFKYSSQHERSALVSEFYFDSHNRICHSVWCLAWPRPVIWLFSCWERKSFETPPSLLTAKRRRRSGSRSWRLNTDRGKEYYNKSWWSYCALWIRIPTISTDPPSGTRARAGSIRNYPGFVFTACFMK